MAAQIAVVDSPDTLHLSEEAQAALRLRPGARVAVTIEEDRVILEPVAQQRVETESAELDELYGAFSSTPGLAEDLREWRSQDKW